MIPMMLESLLELKTGESEADLRALVEEFVGRLTGRQTIYQMMEFVDEMKKRGGQPLEPLEYKHIYLDRLTERIKDRIEALEQERTTPEEMMVPGARRLIEALKERGLKLYLASGTDEQYMKREAALLRVDQYFDGGLYGAQESAAP
jgi:phosphoserine phosphatase